MQTNFAKPDAYPVDGRGLSYSMAYFSAKQFGDGSVLFMTIVDKGRPALRTARTYRLSVPGADAPVSLYWSATVYDRATHALIRDMPYSSRASNSVGLQARTPTGSIDVYSAQGLRRARNRIGFPTSANGQFEILFRLYGPEKRCSYKTWKLPDIEKISANDWRRTSP